jgi:hypothetical protein
MCDFCEGNEIIDTTIGDYRLKIRLDEKHKEFIKVRIEYGCKIGSVGLTRLIKINYCFYCGKKLG